MIKVSVLYPNRAGATFDMEYYCKRHMALVRQLGGAAVKGIAVDGGIGSGESPAPYLAIGHLWFDSVEAFQVAMAAHGPALLADVPNYTNIQPVIQVSRIELAEEPAAQRAAS
jgi:uncharacterized protein (TIGR02118 family)